MGSSLRAAPATGSIGIQNCVITGWFTVRNQFYVIKHAGFNVDQSQIAGVVRLGNGQFADFKSLKQ